MPKGNISKQFVTFAPPKLTFRKGHLENGLTSVNHPFRGESNDEEFRSLAAKERLMTAVNSTLGHIASLNTN